jgi:ABC-2 type transport system permease protein
LAGRVDPVLATPVSRRRWASSHLVVALGGTALLALVCGVAMGAGAALVLGDAGRVAELAAAGAVMVPAMWVLAGAAMLLHGARPQWALAAWALVAWVFVVAMFAPLFDLPQWLSNLSPFEHVPALPAAPMAWLPLVVLTATAGASLAAGLVALDRRDMA